MPEFQAKQIQKASTSGTKPLHVIVQKRDLRLLHALSTLRIVDRPQACVISGFNSTTRVNARLLKLRQAGFLKRFFFVSQLGGKKAIYCLSKKGSELIGVPSNAIQRPSDSFLIGDKFVAHQLAINQVYCAAHFQNRANGASVQNWRTFTEAISPSSPIIPDAYFEIHSNETVRPMFLEVDLGTEGLPVWNKKINEYLSLAATGEFERIFQKPRFAVAVVTTSEKRMHSLRLHTTKITQKLFYFTTLKGMQEQGFWSSIWHRPDGKQTQSLT